MNTESRNDYLDNLLHGREAVADAGSAWLRTLRMQAVERANELTVPTTRDEEWRFTDLSPLYRIPFRPRRKRGQFSTNRRFELFAIPEAQTRLVFVDGRYSADLSRMHIAMTA